MGTELTYRLTNSNVEINKPNKLNIVINYDKSFLEYIFVHKIEIILPSGDAAMDLIKKGSSCTASIIAGAENNATDADKKLWQASASANIVTITPYSGDVQLIGKHSIQVEIAGLNINSEVGTSQIAITETAQVNTTGHYDKKISYTPLHTYLPIIKSYNGFSLGDLVVDHPEINRGESVQLSWSVNITKDCSLTLSWDGITENVKYQTAYPSDPQKHPLKLYNDTPFSLTATFENDDRIFLRQITVSVIQHHILTFNPSRYDLLLGDNIKFTWQTEGVNNCKIKKNEVVVKDKLDSNSEAVIEFERPLGAYILFAYKSDNSFADSKSATIQAYDLSKIKLISNSNAEVSRTIWDPQNKKLSVIYAWKDDINYPQIHLHTITCDINIENDQVKINEVIQSSPEVKWPFPPPYFHSNVNIVEIQPLSTNSLAKIELDKTQRNVNIKSNFFNNITIKSFLFDAINDIYIKYDLNELKAYIFCISGVYLIKSSSIQHDNIYPLLSFAKDVTSESLYVSMKLDTWVVNRSVATAQPKHPERGIRRWQSVFNNLNDFNSPEMQPFSGEDQSFSQDNNMGVYLHWTLPQGLRHATKKQLNGNLEYPLIPNRWLVARFYGSAEKRQVATWIIESDLIDHQNGTTPFPDPSQVGQNLIGRKVELKNWQENAADKKMFLTAVGNGDITFSAYQPYGENVFSFHDPLLSESSIKKDNLSYFVAGWYSNIKENPFYNCQTEQDFVKCLDEYLFENESTKLLPASIPNNIICHAMVTNINWDIDGDIPEQSLSAQDKIDPKKIKVALGNTSLDALTALVSQHDPSIPDDLFKAFSLGLLDKLEETDGEGEVAHKNHQLGFGVENGGSLWTIVSDESAENTGIDLTDDQISLLNMLNNKQISFDEKTRCYQADQWQLYAIWYKHGQAQANAYSQKAELKKQIAQNLNNLSQSYQQLTALKLDLNNSYQSLFSSLTKSQKLKKLQNDVFWHPNDPVVLVTGIQSGWRENSTTSKDAWRTENKILTSIQVGNKQINIADIDKIIPLVPFDKIPVNINKLYQECFLLDTANANAISIATGIKTDDFINARNALIHNPNASLPRYGLQPWIQAWFPLFMEWEIEWFPIPFENWKFADKNYVVQTIPSKIDSQILVGRTLLTPQASFSVKSRLQQLLKDNPDIEKELDKIDFKKLLQTVDEWDVLSQCISGFHQQLILRDTKAARTPANQKEELNLYKYISDQCHMPPMAGAVTSDPFSTITSLFQPIRNGQFCFQRLSIVDRFGQTVNVVQSHTYQNYVPIMSNELKPDSNLVVSKESPLRFIQLTPRIIQSMRLNADWISAKDDKKSIKRNMNENPIYGWLVPNYLDQGLQIYDASGKYLGELRALENTTDKMINNIAQKTIHWTPAPNSKYVQVEDLIHDSKPEYSILGGIISRIKAAPLEDFQTLFKIFDDMYFNTQNHCLQKNSTYLSAFAGRPLALARSQWQLELAQPPYADQSWTPDSEKEKAFLTYKYSLKLGDPAFNQNGLVGYFIGNEWNTFYTVYPEQVSKNSQYIKNVNDNLPVLTIASKTPLFTTLLIDPYAKVYAYSDILPVVNLMLPHSYFKNALQQMEVTFRVGPLLTLRTQNTPNAENKQLQTFLRIPKTSIKKNWQWLEKTVDDKWQEVLTQSTDDRAKLESDNYEITTGLLTWKMWEQPKALSLTYADPSSLNQKQPKKITTDISNNPLQPIQKLTTKEIQTAACKTLKFARVLSQFSTFPTPFNNLSNQNIIHRILFFAQNNKNLNDTQINNIVSYGRDKQILKQKHDKEQFLKMMKLT